LSVSLPLPADPTEHEPPPSADPASSGRGRSAARTAIEWGLILAVAVVAAILIRSFVVQPFFIPTGSMEPTLQVGDRVLVNKLSYDFHSVHRGDVVVFAKPADDTTPGIKDLVKRVIGLPGETISAQNGQVYINGRPLAEPWLPKVDRDVTTFQPSIPGCLPAPSGACRIPAGDYFMMGDNRTDSADSRVIGPVPGHLFIGRAFVRVWPLGRLGWL
jgi:signal peptidase I